MDPVAWLLLMAIGLFMALLYKSMTESPSRKRKESIPGFARFPDRYDSLDMVREALVDAGLESCNLIVGIDYTSSNLMQGRHTFGGKSLHTIDPSELNPYQKVIAIIGKTLAALDEDQLIPTFGFGDLTTKGHSVFPFYPNGRPCEGFADVLERYASITPGIRLSGPTSFAPIIEEAIRIVQQSGQMEYHILLLIADGQVTNEKQTIAAIEKASAYPLSIVMVGVGDGPWDTMQEFDDKLPSRQFDNFQFVDYHEAINSTYPDAAFALSALQEIPQQFSIIKRLGLLGKPVER